MYTLSILLNELEVNTVGNCHQMWDMQISAALKKLPRNWVIMIVMQKEWWYFTHSQCHDSLGDVMFVKLAIRWVPITFMLNLKSVFLSMIISQATCHWHSKIAESKTMISIIFGRCKWVYITIQIQEMKHQFSES